MGPIEKLFESCVEKCLLTHIGTIKDLFEIYRRKDMVSLFRASQLCGRSAFSKTPSLKCDISSTLIQH